MKFMWVNEPKYDLKYLWHALSDEKKFRRISFAFLFSWHKNEWWNHVFLPHNNNNSNKNKKKRNKLFLVLSYLDSNYVFDLSNRCIMTHLKKFQYYSHHKKKQKKKSKTKKKKKQEEKRAINFERNWYVSHIYDQIMTSKNIYSNKFHSLASLSFSISFMYISKKKNENKKVT